MSKDARLPGAGKGAARGEDGKVEEEEAIGSSGKLTTLCGKWHKQCIRQRPQ